MAFEDYIVPMRRMTPSEVFACLGRIDGDIDVLELTGDSPLTALYGRWLQPRPRNIRRQLKGAFDIYVPEQVIRASLYPLEERTLDDLCGLIAKHVWVEEISEVNLFGSRCRIAGAFLAIRSVLQKAGIETSEIAPSTPLQEVLISNPETIWPLQRLAPLEAGRFGVVNEPVIWTGLLTALAACGVLLSGCIGIPEAAAMSAMAFIIGVCVTFVLARMRGCREISPACLKNFRDLATLIAGERSKGFAVTSSET